MTTNNNSYLISYHSLRRLIGVLGILLPFLCWGVNSFVNDLHLLNNPYLIDAHQSKVYVAGANLKSSVSHFYYTTAGPLFTGIMITVAIFLFCYKGFPKDKMNDRFAWLTDSALASFAACCALGIVTFPTNSSDTITDNIYIFVSSGRIGKLHEIFAVLFFLSMAVMCIINFRRHPNKQLIRGARGTLYLVCGWGIIACLVILGINNFISGGGNWLWGRFVYFMEVPMLLFFGIAWLVKGKSSLTEFILKKTENG